LGGFFCGPVGFPLRGCGFGIRGRLGGGGTGGKGEGELPLEQFNMS